MIPNSKAFNGKTSFEYEGKTYYRWHKISERGSFTLRFKIVEINSKNKQAIALFFSDFKGTLALNGKKLPVLLNKFQHYLFKQDDLLNNEFVLSVCAEHGSLVLGNASERAETPVYTCGAFGNAFWIESIAQNHFRFHCNDHEYDDDFNDFIFDMIIHSNL